MSEMSHNQSLEVVTPSLERAAIAKEVRIFEPLWRFLPSFFQSHPYSRAMMIEW